MKDHLKLSSGRASDLPKKGRFPVVETDEIAAAHKEEVPDLESRGFQDRGDPAAFPSEIGRIVRPEPENKSRDNRGGKDEDRNDDRFGTQKALA
jgi:hypothetical protein